MYDICRHPSKSSHNLETQFASCWLLLCSFDSVWCYSPYSSMGKQTQRTPSRSLLALAEAPAISSTQWPATAYFQDNMRSCPFFHKPTRQTPENPKCI